MKKPRVLILTQWFVPAYKAGGPVTSIYNLVQALKDEVDFWIICGNRDLGSSEDLGVEPDAWMDQLGAHVYYTSSAAKAREQIKSELQSGEWSSIYMNSLFSPTWTLYPLLLLKRMSLKRLLAPRGMLGAGALQIKSFKKRSFLRLARVLNLFANVHWHATDSTEKNEIELNFGEGSSVEVIPNLPSQVPMDLENMEGRDRSSILFVSRISKKKNLLFLLQRLAEIKEPYELTVVGPSEDRAYELECSEFATKAGLKVHWKGAILPMNLGEELIKHSMMALPTRHENYGHVILQAWGYGLPVLLSNNTPWQNLEQVGLGWDLPLEDHKAWYGALQKHWNMPEKELTEWRKKCHSFVLEKLAANDDVLAYKKLFESEY